MSDTVNVAGASSTDTSVTAKDVLAPETQVEAAPDTEVVETEVVAEPETKPELQTEEDKRFAAKFAALSRREKLANQRERALKTREAALEAKSKTPETTPTPEVPLKARLMKDPFGTLKELGLDYETLTRMALNDGKMTPELQMQIMREEIKAELDGKYGKEIDDIKKTRQEEAEATKKAAEERQITAYKTEIGNFITTNKEKYELVEAEGEEATELIYSKILEDYSAKLEANGEVAEDEIMKVDEAADIVEEMLLEEAKKRINLSKIKKLLEPVQKVPEVEPKSGKKVSPTLSNDQAQEQGAKKRFLSDDESRAESAKMIRWVE